MENALIIFVRPPELGKVKTRLAAKIGKEKALHIYIKLLQHTRMVALEVTCDKYVFATDRLDQPGWEFFKEEIQVNGDLGKKMSHAFEFLFEKGYSNIVIIGSDCPGLTSAHIDTAFKKLKEVDVVIGPTEDGGYFLLGMKKNHATLFENKAWSTPTVFKDTVDTIESLQLSMVALEKLEDVDEEKDIPLSWKKELEVLFDLTDSK